MDNLFHVQFKEFEKFKYTKIEIYVPDSIITNIETDKYNIIDYINVNIINILDDTEDNNNNKIVYTRKFLNEEIPIYEKMFDVPYIIPFIKNNETHIRCPIYLNFDEYLESFFDSKNKNNKNKKFLITVEIKLQ